MTEETKKIIEYKKRFLAYHSGTIDPEINEMLRCIRKTDLFCMMNCETQYDYHHYIVNCGYDSNCHLPYVTERGKRIYFPGKYDETEVTWRFLALIKEQDAFSPHRYLDDASFKVIRQARNEGKKIIVVELGAMEGMFSLSLADMADELHLFESDKDWAAALEESFRPWSDKTTITDKFVGDGSDERCVAVDDSGISAAENTLLIMKMDIEGNERYALKGMRRLLEETGDFLLFVSTYHKKDDEVYVRRMFEDCEIWNNEGFFCFYAADDYEEPFIRRCVLKIKKRKQGKWID